MKLSRFVMPLLAVVLLLASVLTPAVLAMEPMDPDHESELIIEYVYEGEPIPDAPFCLYRIADVSAEGEVTMCEAFRDYPVDMSEMTQEKYRALAQTLNAYVKLDQLIPDAVGVTNEYGFAEITGLKPGLFLLTGERHIGDDGMFISSPSIVSIPSRLSEDSPWLYSVTVLPKCTFQPHGGMGVTSQKVLKIWDDKGNEAARPSSIKVILLCNGMPYDTVELSAANGWSYVWQDLPAGEEWLVVEVVPEGYSVLITESGALTQIYNTNDAPPPPTTEPDDKTPQTGMLWWPMPILVLAGVVFIVLGIRLKRGYDHEA